MLIGTGGFAGSISRYLIARYIELNLLSSFPLGTLIVNIAGSFIIGVIYGLALKDMATPEIRFLLATGFCGGFTTFSSFSYESFTLMQDGQLWYVFLYIGGSLLLGLVAVWLGIAFTKLG